MRCHRDAFAEKKRYAFRIGARFHQRPHAGLLLLFCVDDVQLVPPRPTEDGGDDDDGDDDDGDLFVSGFTGVDHRLWVLS